MSSPRGIKFSKEEIVGKLTDLFSRRKEVVFAYLFGSLAEDKIHKFSDVDVAVYVHDLTIEKEFDYKLELIGKLNHLLRSDDVDLVVLNHTLPTLCHHVLHHGILLNCKDEGYRRRYLVKSFKEYEDAQHLLKIQYQYRDQRLADYGKR